MRGHHSPVALDTLEHAAHNDQPFAWTIALSIPAGHLWRSIRVAPVVRPEANGNTTAQVLLASTRLGATPVLYTKGKRREQEEAPIPLTPDEIEMQNDLDC